MKAPRIYIDTSVVGGCLDEEFSAESNALFREARAGNLARADAIASWNFRHIVRLDKIRAYNAVNLLHGYGILTILSPKEVVGHDEEDV